MGFDAFDSRALLAFPGGDNDTDTVFSGVHFNLTTLEHWNYTYYDNNTLSNGSKCWLTFEPYQPAQLLNNGTFVNGTSCYSAIESIGTRGYVGIGFAVAFGIALVLTITALAKHGPLYLPKERRFYPIGRRWQWYWGCFTCGAALISLFTNVDIDRYYLQDLPIIVTVFFFYLMCVGTVAMVWEAVRHWGSWMERQYIDPNPFVYQQDDRRAKTEFYLPLWCYFWLWLDFFMVVPRSWNFVKMQRSDEQIEEIFVPGATGARFKVAGFCLFISWLTICFSLNHSVSYYKEKRRGFFRKVIDCVTTVPLRFVLIIPLSLGTIAYQLFISWEWEYSVMKAEANIPVVYAWGYGPSLLILYIQILYGYFSPNEDKELYRQRHERGDRLNRELGIVNKPAWWRRVRGDHLLSMRDKLLHNVHEVGQTTGVGRREEDDFERTLREDARHEALDDDDIEMNNMNDPFNPRVDRAGARALAEGEVGLAPPSGPVGGEGFFAHGDRPRLANLSLHHVPPPPPYTDVERGPPPSTRRAAERTNSTSSDNSLSSPPQRVKSMLDV